MKHTNGTNVLVSQSEIWTWLSRVGQTGAAYVEHCAPREIAFAREDLKERLHELRRNTRCVRRAVQLMIFLTALSVVGLGHSTVFLPFWPQTLEQFFMQWTIKAHCVLGLASLSSAIAFSMLGLLYRRELRQLSSVENPQLIPLPVSPRILPPVEDNAVAGPSLPIQDVA